jgi:hypothetical protein
MYSGHFRTRAGRLRFEEGATLMVRSLAATLLAVTGIALGAEAIAQATPAPTFIGPSDGQTSEQQGKDNTECKGWAMQAAGFDPLKALEPQQAETTRTQQQTPQVQQAGARQASGATNAPVHGAVGGAAAGAAIGAIAGNAGRGAAIGAAGVLAGAAARRERQAAAAQQQRQIAAQQAQVQVASKQKLIDYNRAFQTCMQGRGYTLNQQWAVSL